MLFATRTVCRTCACAEAGGRVVSCWSMFLKFHLAGFGMLVLACGIALQELGVWIDQLSNNISLSSLLSVRLADGLRPALPPTERGVGHEMLPELAR